MLDTVTILLIVASKDAGDPALPALRAAVVEAARGEASVIIEERDALPTDDEAAALAEAAHAGVVTELRWEGANRERVWMHVHVARSPTWFEREITFRPSDAAAERGRAIGVVLAAMLPELDRQSAETPATPESTLVVTPAPVPVVAPGPPPKPVEASARRRYVAAIGASATGGTGLGAPLRDAGVALDGRWLALPRLAVRVAGQVSFGSVDAAHATAQTWAIGAGASVVLLTGTPARPELAVRADLGASYLRLTRPRTQDGAEESNGRWLPAVALAGEASFRLTPALAMTAALGAEAVLGTTDIVVDGGIATPIAPVRALGELGLRVRF